MNAKWTNWKLIQYCYKYFRQMHKPFCSLNANQAKNLWNLLYAQPRWITSKQLYFLSRANLKHSLQKVVSWRDELGKQKDRWRKSNESGTAACTRKWMRRTRSWYDLSRSILLCNRPINKLYDVRVFHTLTVDLNSLIPSHKRLHLLNYHV